MGDKKDNDPRVLRTRRLLEQAFLDLVAERSIESISVQDIAQRATVNRGTFYDHFEDKYALLEYCIRDRFTQFLLSNLPTDSGIRDLPLLARTVMEYFARTHQRIRRSDRHFYPLIETTVQHELYTLLFSWLERAYPGKSPEREVKMTTATVMSWALLGAGNEWAHGTRTLPLDEMAAQVVSVLLKGMSQVMEPS